MEGGQLDSPHTSAASQAQTTVMIAAPQEELIVHSLQNQSPGQSGAIIVKVNPQAGFPSSSKLKSLLPKGLVSSLPKPGVPSLPYRDITDTGTNIDSDLVNTVISSPEILNSPLQNKSSQPSSSLSSSAQPLGEITPRPVRSDGIEHILQHLGGTISTLPFPESPMDSVQDQAKESLSHPINESSQDTSSADQIVLKSSDEDAGARIEKEPSSPAPHPSFSFDEKEQDSDVIKKTMVEAFVKMVVCRKVTVQRVHSKTGQVLDTKVKTEEEDPVILGVDCVETTEDLAGSSTTETKGSTTNDLSTTKWGSSLDGGLKFLSAVSESRQKIGKSLIKEKLIKSALQSSSLTQISAPESRDPSGDLPKPEEGFTVKVSPPKASKPEVKIEAKDDSDFEWDEDLNDDSEDFVPSSFTKLHRNSSITTRNQKNTFTNNGISKEAGKSDSVVLLPKKRGRKRKWDNALGLSVNLRKCQFCNKHFKSVKSCAKHMKKGDCVSSVFCFICSKGLNDERELEEHLSSHRNESKSSSYECQDCHREYRTKAGYIKHFRMGTCQKRENFEDGCSGEFLCDLCDSRFSTEDYLKLHRYKVHENPRDRHDCPDCGKKFYSFQGFQKHRSAKSCTEPLKCHICGKTYSNKAKESFKIHMKHHKSEVTGLTFNCEECGRAYMTQMALNKHKLSHTGVKPYKCETCGKEFSMRYMVKDHARMHTGERPFLCSLCGSAFSNKGHLGRHLRSHENGTLLRRGRPKKIREPEESIPQETELKMIDLREALQGFDGQSIQVVDGQVFDAQGNSTPMIIQADNNTIIIAEGWPEAAGATPAVGLDGTHEIVNVANSIVPNLNVS